jgi:hypothetical protein
MVRRLNGAIAVLMLLMSAGSVRPLQGQATLSPVQNLTFGQLVPGVATRVAPTDVIRRGELTISGFGTFSIMFTLPTVLRNDANGATIPLTFGAADGMIKRDGQVQTFSPAAGATVKLLNPHPSADIYLGGTAQPSANQLAGTYSATVTVYYIQTGN